MGKMVFNSYAREWLLKQDVILESALNRMGEDGVKLIQMRIPFASGDLFKKVEHVKIDTLAHRLRVESPYASYQEAGKRRDGSHVVKKYSTPNTGKEFMKKAAKSLEQNGLNYLKQAVLSVYNGV